MPKEPKARPEELRFKQIVCPQFSDYERKLTYSTIGLTEDGRVFRYDPKCFGWIPWSMAAADCRDEHPGKR